MSNAAVLDACCRIGGGNMLETSVLAHRILLHIFLLSAIHKTMKTCINTNKKKVSCGSQMSCALGPEPPKLFYLAYGKSLLIILK